MDRQTWLYPCVRNVFAFTFWGMLWVISIATRVHSVPQLRMVASASLRSNRVKHTSTQTRRYALCRQMLVVRDRMPPLQGHLQLPVRLRSTATVSQWACHRSTTRVTVEHGDRPCAATTKCATAAGSSGAFAAPGCCATCSAWHVPTARCTNNQQRCSCTVQRAANQLRCACVRTSRSGGQINQKERRLKYD